MTKYKIKIDREACDGDQLCACEAPGTFDMDDEGKAVVVNPDGDPPEDIMNAARACPLDGITLYDAETGERVFPWV